MIKICANCATAQTKQGQKLAFQDHIQEKARDKKEGRSVGVKVDQNLDHGEKGKEKGKALRNRGRSIWSTILERWS